MPANPNPHLNDVALVATLFIVKDCFNTTGAIVMMNQSLKINWVASAISRDPSDEFPPWCVRMA